MLRIDLPRARAHWHARQGLTTPLPGSVEDVIAATGWPRTLGGADVYLAVRARVPGMKRAALDEAVASRGLQVIPAARGCIYLVPRADVPLALRVAEDQYRKRAERELEKVGVTEKELADVGEAVVQALGKGGLATDALRRALPEGTVRSLGERGKKVGLSSPLPPALRHLEFAGKVERTLEGGRLDSERYTWRLPARSPLAGAKVPDEAVERHAAVARRFLASAGPVSLADVAAWAGLSQRDARAALERTPAVAVAVDGYAEEAFLLEEDLPALGESAPAPTAISLLPFEDNFLVLHGGPAPLVSPEHQGRTVSVWGSSKKTTLGEAKHLSARALLDGDRLAGFWEYDPDAKEVVLGTFTPLPLGRLEAARALADDVGQFLRDEIGHARSVVLDTEDELRARSRIVEGLARE